MSETQITLILSVMGAGVAAALVTFFLVRAVYGSRMGDMAARMDKVEKSRSRTNEMLLQARRQTETLQKELVLARRTPRSNAPAASAEEKQAKTDAQMEALRRAKELMDEADKTIVLRGPSGFAETQPLSGFGPNVR